MGQQKQNRKQRVAFAQKKYGRSTTTTAPTSTRNELEDEVDLFHKQKDLIPFDEDETVGSEEEDEDETEALGLDLSSDEEEEEEEEDEEEGEEEEEEEEEEDEEAEFGSDDSEFGEEEEDGIVDEDTFSKRWGKNKRKYYGTDAKERKGDDDLATEEELEALRLQRRKFGDLSQEDFEDEHSLGALSQLAEGKGVKSQQGVSKVDVEMDDDMALEEDVEALRKDFSSLSKEQKLEILKRDSPELQDLIKEFKESLADVREKLRPLIQRIKDGEIKTEKGVSYLEVKYQLMLSYCTNICFYLLLKAEGKQVKDHPVIDQLVKIRVILEKLRPLDHKLKHQIDKLLQTATIGSTAHLAKDPRRFKPNVEDFADLDEEEEQEEAPPKAGVYKPPMLMAQAQVDEKLVDRQRKKEERKRDRAAKSSMFKFIEQEFGDAPEETPQIGATIGGDLDQEEIRRQNYEEEHMTRLQLTKKDKKRQMQKIRNSQQVDQLADFENISVMDEQSEDPTEAFFESRKRSVNSILQNSKQSNKRQKSKGRGRSK